MTDRVTMRAHAKLNLYLRIEGRRADGFHDLTSVFHAIDLADDVTLRPGPGVTMAMEVPGEIAEEENLAARAVAAVGDPDHLGVDVTKRIPLAAGLGGGSADAGAALVGARHLLGLSMSDDALAEVGASLGSDVPFFVHGFGTALVQGRGEKVTGLECPHIYWFVVGVSFTPLATGDVYARWDEMTTSSTIPSIPIDAVADAVTTGDVVGLGASLHSDLEAAAMDMVPELASKKEALLGSGALGALVAGSGPTLFALAAGPQQAQEIAEATASLFDRVHVVASSIRSVERVR